MKKLLLGSTALVAGGVMAAPAMAADPIKLGVGGYYTFYGVAGNIDPTYALNGSLTQYKGFDIMQEGEIHFIGQTKLDNGTSVGLTVELEGWNPNTARLVPPPATRRSTKHSCSRSATGAVSRWARRDAASYRMYYGTPSAFIGFGAFQHNHNWARRTVIGNNKAYGRTMATTITPQWQDVNRVNYFTPRFAGLQIGVGYAPKMNIPSATWAARASRPARAARPASAATPRLPNPQLPDRRLCLAGSVRRRRQLPEQVRRLHRGAVRRVRLRLVRARLLAARRGPPANMITGANLTSWKQWVVGAQFGFAGFTVGGALGWDNNGVGGNYFTGGDNDTRFYTAGIMYETGPWQISFMWAGFYNTNGNGSSNVTRSHRHQAQDVEPAEPAATVTGQQHVLQRQSRHRGSVRPGIGQQVGNGCQLRAGTGHQAGRRLDDVQRGGPTNACQRQHLGVHARHGPALLVAVCRKRKERAKARSFICDFYASRKYVPSRLLIDCAHGPVASPPARGHHAQHLPWPLRRSG